MTLTEDSPSMGKYTGRLDSQPGTAVSHMADSNGDSMCCLSVEDLPEWKSGGALRLKRAHPMRLVVSVPRSVVEAGGG